LEHILEEAGLKVVAAVARDVLLLAGRTKEEEHHWKQQREMPKTNHCQKMVLLQRVQVGKVVGRVSHEN